MDRNYVDLVYIQVHYNKTHQKQQVFSDYKHNARWREAKTGNCRTFTGQKDAAGQHKKLIGERGSRNVPRGDTSFLTLAKYPSR